jgi:hypothetical protein
MADKDSSSPAGGNLTGILAVVMLVVGAVWVTQVPLEGSRPPNPDAIYRHPGSLQDVDARMWEDPFDAVERYRKREQAEERGTEERQQRQALVDAVKCLSVRSQECETVLKRDTRAAEGYQRRADQLAEESSLRQLLAKGNATLLLVTVTGAPYGMASEWRRKQRYAVLSGLHLAGYEPFDPEHIGFVEFEDAARDETLPLPSILPYEVFYRRTRAGETEHLVIAWFNEDVLWSDDPLEQLHQVFARIAYGEKADKKRDGLAIKVLGPGSSGMVRELREDYLVRPKGEERGKQLARMFRTSQAEFYASSPTASDASLVEVDSDVSACLEGKGEEVRALREQKQRVEAEFRCRGIALHRITVTDEKLAQALAGELKLRGAWRQASGEGVEETIRSSPHVVLVSEWDTHYGREFPRIMRDALLGDVPDDAKTRDAVCSAERLVGAAERATACPIHYYSYMMGLDGQVSRAGEVRVTAPPADKSDKQRERGHEVERPVGSAQLDYLRRLSEKIVSLDAELRSGGNRIGAIGVLGTDPYDKLLVMQALHPSLPEAIFFTTDLDALYLHPTEVRRGTKNLVIASAFGLALDDRWQGSILPFRDTYQTGAFLSTLLALGAKPGATDELARSLRAPRIYEVGSTSLVDLSPVEAPCAGSACETIHPQRRLPELKARNVTSFVFAGVVLLVLFAFGFRQMQYGLAALGSFARMQPALSIAALVILTLLLGFSLRALRDATGEPWAIANGVSMWPTQILRLVTLVLTWMMLVKGWRDLAASNGALARDFILGGDGTLAAERPGSLVARLARRLRVLLAQVRERFRPWEHDATAYRLESRSVGDTWNAYIQPAGFGDRLWLLAVPITLYVAFTAILFHVFGWPARPYRGSFILMLDSTMLALCSVSFFLLLFFVIDETRRTCAFVRRLTRPSKWPPEALEKFGQRAGLADCASVHPDLVAYLEDWVEVNLIGQRTEVVTRLIYYPFIIITLLVLARSSTFDNWTTPPQLIAVFGLSIVIALAAAVALRLAAENARGAALDNLTAKLLRAEQVGEERIAAEIRILIDRVRDTRQGAFCPFSQQPWLKAVLIPLGSLSAVPILEFLAAASL